MNFGRDWQLLDYVRNDVLRTHHHDLILGDEKFVRSDLRHLLAYKGWKASQFDIRGDLLADLDLGAAGHLLNMQVFQHDFFNNVILLSGELDRPGWNRVFIIRWGLSKGTTEQKPANSATTKGARFNALKFRHYVRPERLTLTIFAAFLTRWRHPNLRVCLVLSSHRPD